MDHLGQLAAERPCDPLLHLLVRPVVGAADDVRDAEVEIVDDRRELVGRRAVGARQRRPGEADRAVRIAHARRRRARAAAASACALGSFALPDRPFVPADPEPLEIGENRLLAAGDDALRVGVVDAQHERATVLVGECAVGDGAERVAEVERAGRARREADADPASRSCVDRDVARAGRRPDRATPGWRGTARGRSRPRARHACRRTARCPRSSSARRRERPARRDGAPSRRARCSRSPSAPRSAGVLLGLARVRDQEAHDRDRRLVLVLLEELPLQHLRALVAISRDVLGAVAEVPEDRVRLGERAAVVEHERRHPPRRVEVAEHLGAVRAVDDAQLVGARAGRRAGPRGGAPCSNCRRRRSCRGASAQLSHKRLGCRPHGGLTVRPLLGQEPHGRVTRRTLLLVALAAAALLPTVASARALTGLRPSPGPSPRS